MKKTVFFLSCIILLSAILSGCQPAKPPVLVDYGPTVIRAGQDFNMQPSGDNAMWAHTQNATLTSVLILNGIKLDSHYHDDTKLVTATVPKRLFEKAGEYPLYLLDTKTNLKSNELKFVVKP
jgi:hypothetical protein